MERKRKEITEVKEKLRTARLEIENLKANLSRATAKAASEISTQYLCIQFKNSKNTYFLQFWHRVITDGDVLAEELSRYKDEAERTAAEKKTSAKTTVATEASQEEFLRDQVIIFNQCKYTQTHTKTCS